MLDEVVDTTTGEILEANQGYADIDSLEEQLFLAIGSELDLKLAQTRVLITINDRGLYRQRLDDSGRPYQTFTSYLKSIAPRLGAAGMGKLRSLQNWVLAYKIYVQTLGKPETFLRDLGSHAHLMIPAAAKAASGQLLEVSEPTEMGGQRLGRSEFSTFVQEIEEKVADSQSGIPEASWSTNDTRERVKEIIGSDEEKVRVQVDASWVGSDIRLKSLTYWIGDFAYKISDIWKPDHFKKVFSSAQVEGLGDNWKD